MGQVKLDLPYEGIRCNGCEWELDGEDTIGDFCGLFNRLKESGVRCIECHMAEAQC